MNRYSLTHLSDQTLLHDLAALVARDRATTAALLAHVAEVDARKLYLPAAYPSMFSYCLGELHLCEQAAYKRIFAGRAARRFPALFDALAEGRLHLSAVVLLAPHLSEEAADELIAVATHKSKSEIERLLAERFPRPDIPTLVQAVAPPSTTSSPEQLSPGIVEQVPGRADGQRVPEPVDHPRVTPLAPQRYALQVTLDQGTRDKLRHAQALLGHAIPSGDLALVLDRALDALIRELERRKLAATARPRAARETTHARHVPAHVRRAVWRRDGGRCTFVSATGQRCAARTRLEFDHVDEVARGGRATVSGIRLRCRAHNQYAAECTFGAEFMRRKREAGRPARWNTAGAAPPRVPGHAAKPPAAAATTAAAPFEDQDVIPWLRQLGLRADEARRAAAQCEHIPDAPLEERLRVALRSFGGRASSTGRVGVDAAHLP